MEFYMGNTNIIPAFMEKSVFLDICAFSVINNLLKKPKLYKIFKLFSINFNQLLIMGNLILTKQA